MTQCEYMLLFVLPCGKFGYNFENKRAKWFGHNSRFHTLVWRLKSEIEKLLSAFKFLNFLKILPEKKFFISSLNCLIFFLLNTNEFMYTTLKKCQCIYKNDTLVNEVI